MKRLVATALLLAGAACGASFKGPATIDPTDRCHGKLDCGAAGCCEASADDGWECNAPGARTVCSEVGIPLDPQSPSFGARSDAGPPESEEPDDPNLGEPPPGHGGQG